MGSPRVTVIVPAYNAEAYLDDCLRSIRDQSFTDFVCNVYDDGSQDQTLAIARRFSDEDERFRAIPGKNLGTPRRVAAAYREVTSEFFCQVDADDMLTPDALGLTTKVLSGCPEHVGVVYSDYQRITEDGVVETEDPAFDGRCRTVFSLQRMQQKGFCAFQFRLVRTSAYQGCRGVDASVPTGEDFDLVLKLAERTQFVHIPQPLYLYRQHSGQTSRKNPSHLEVVCKKMMEDSYTRKSQPSFAVVIPYTGVDDAFALRQWVQQVASADILVAIVTDDVEDADVVECKAYSHSRVEVIKKRDEETDYGYVVSRMVKGAPTYEFTEALVPSPGVVEDLIRGNSVPVLTLEPRSSWLLQSAGLQSDVVPLVAQGSAEIVGDGPPGNSALYRLTREELT